MEYTVGSVADLISGKNTPNKPNVIQKQLPQPQVKTNTAKVPGIEKGPAKAVKTESFTAKPFGRGNEAPFKRGNKPFFDKKAKVGNYGRDASFSKGRAVGFKKGNSFAAKPFGGGNEAPFKRGNKPFFDKKNKVGNYVQDSSFSKGSAVGFKKGNKPRLNKKIKEESADADKETDFTVIDHKLVEKLEKGESECKTEPDHNSDDSAESDTSEDDNKEDLHSQSPSVKKELDSRTVFVGNIIVTVTKKQLSKLFSKFGKVEAVRLRCVTPSNPGVSKRVAVIKKMFHPKRTTMHSYVRFEKREDALKALELNGIKYKDHRLRVQMSDESEKPDSSKAVFVGNLPFDVEDDDLWAAFETFGTIKSVRVIRNAATGMGIGIGYVNFDSSDSVEFALQMEDVTIKKNVVRIQRCNDKGKKTRKARRQERRKRTDTLDAQKSSKPKHKEIKKPWKKQGNEKNKFMNMGQKEISKKANGGERPKWLSNKFKDSRSSTINIKNSVFQGSKSDKKKQKPKVNKGFIQKLKLSQKVAPKPTM